MTECSEEGCDKPHLAKGLCRNHYYRLKRNGHTGLQDRTPNACTAPGCPSVAKSKGLCSRHYQQVRNRGAIQPDPVKVSFDEWFWAQVDRSGGPDACHLWTGGCTNGYGYARRARVHRIAYVLTFGEIPDGKEIDHACHDPAFCRGGDSCVHRRCCNPAHLKPRTHRENCAADRTILATLNLERRNSVTRCPAGHPYDDANTYVSKAGKRYCRACNREKAAEARKRKKQQASM